MNVLIVDDNAINQKLLRAILESDRHRVLEARDGLDALDILKVNHVEVVISDVLMPRMDGYRLCHEVRKSEHLKHLRFVFYTATYTSPTDEKLCLALGADRYIRKPASSHELLTAIEESIAGPPRKPEIALSTTEVLSEYSERLVDKLEESNVELQNQSEELAAVHAQLQTLLANSPAVIYTLQIDGDRPVPTLVSDNMERLLGIPVANASYDWWLESLHPEDCERVVTAKKAVSAETGARLEYRVRHVDGTYRWIEDSSRVVRDEAGVAAKLVGVWMDISARKLAEERLEQTLAELELRVAERTASLARINEELLAAMMAADTANKSKSEFLSRMSHELRTPMNSILGFGQLLELTSLDAGQRESVDHILRGGRHLLALINEVLEISRIEAGALSLSLEAVELTEIIRDCIALIVPLANERGVMLQLDHQPYLYVNADRQRLVQVIINLLSNAVKYNVPGGKVTVRLAKEDHSLGLIEVIDTGIGIPEAMIHKLFQPFERIAAERTDVEGTGLGLTLSKSLIEAMDGTLMVETREGVGSTFRVRLNLADEGVVQRAEVQLSTSDPSIWDGLAGRILAIEDNPMNTKLLAQLFARWPDIELVTTMRGKSGLEIASDRIPDAILLDLHLPDMDGIEVLAALKADSKLCDVPVIIVTADAYYGQSQALIDAGAFRYLTKPFVLTDLISAVADALVQHRGS